MKRLLDPAARVQPPDADVQRAAQRHPAGRRRAGGQDLADHGHQALRGTASTRSDPLRFVSAHTPTVSPHFGGYFALFRAILGDSGRIWAEITLSTSTIELSIDTGLRAEVVCGGPSLGAHPKLLFLSGYRARQGMPGGNFGLVRRCRLTAG